MHLMQLLKELPCVEKNKLHCQEGGLWWLDSEVDDE